MNIWELLFALAVVAMLWAAIILPALNSPPTDQTPTMSNRQ